MRCWHGSDAEAGKSSALLGGSHGMGREGKGLERERERATLPRPRPRNALLCIGVCLAGCLAPVRAQLHSSLWDCGPPISQAVRTLYLAT